MSRRYSSKSPDRKKKNARIDVLSASLEAQLEQKSPEILSKLKRMGGVSESKKKKPPTRRKEKNRLPK